MSATFTTSGPLPPIPLDHAAIRDAVAKRAAEMAIDVLKVRIDFGNGPDPIGRVPLGAARAFQEHEDRQEACAEALRDAWSSPALGTRPTLSATIAYALAVRPDAVKIHELSPGAVSIEVTGRTPENVEEALDVIRDHLPIGVTAQAWHAPPPWTVADARREIDRVLAAEARRGAPFLRAKRAAIATLSSDLPGRNPAPVAKVIHGTLAAIEAYEAARPGERRIPEGRTGELYVLAARAYCASTGDDVRHPPVVVYGALDRYERERAR